MAEGTKKVSELELRRIKNGETSTESIDIQYKEVFSISNVQEQLDLVKNVIALANSKGGYVIYGVNAANEWIGLDERSDDKIIYAELIDLFESYINAPIDIVFNLLEIDKSFYFVLFVEENKTNEALYTSKSGFYSIKNWGSKIEKKVYAFQKGDIFVRENNQTILASADFYKKNQIQAFTINPQPEVAAPAEPVAKIQDIVIEEKAVEKAAASDVLNSLPDIITQKIEKIYSLEQLLKELNLQLDNQDSIPTLHANINRINKTILDFKEDLNAKEMAQIKHTEDLARLEFLENANKTLEDDFYELMSIKNKTPFDKTFNLDNVNITAEVRTSLMDLYKLTYNQFQYNWDKKLEELSTGLVANINQNKKEISAIKESIKMYKAEDIQSIKNLIEGQEEILVQEENRIIEINSLLNQIKEIKDEIQELKLNVTTESTNYLKDLVFNKLNKVDLEEKKEILENNISIDDFAFIKEQERAISELLKFDPIFS